MIEALDNAKAATPMRRPLVTGCLLLLTVGAGFTQPDAPPDPRAANAGPPSQAPAAQATAPNADTDAAKPEAKSEASKADANEDRGEKPPTNKAEADKKTGKKESDRGPEFLAQCLGDWDRGTHMTRQEWARTCRRVVSNRVRFLREQGQ